MSRGTTFTSGDRPRVREPGRARVSSSGGGPATPVDHNLTPKQSCGVRCAHRARRGACWSGWAPVHSTSCAGSFATSPSMSIGATTVGTGAATFQAPVVDTGTTLFYVPTGIETAVLTAVNGSAGFKALFGTTQKLKDNGCVTKAGASRGTAPHAFCDPLGNPGRAAPRRVPDPLVPGRPSDRRAGHSVRSRRAARNPGDSRLVRRGVDAETRRAGASNRRAVAALEALASRGASTRRVRAHRRAGLRRPPSGSATPVDLLGRARADFRRGHRVPRALDLRSAVLVRHRALPRLGLSAPRGRGGGARLASRGWRRGAVGHSVGDHAARRRGLSPASQGERDGGARARRDRGRRFRRRGHPGLLRRGWARAGGPLPGHLDRACPRAASREAKPPPDPAGDGAGVRCEHGSHRRPGLGGRSGTRGARHWRPPLQARLDPVHRDRARDHRGGGEDAWFRRASGNATRVGALPAAAAAYVAPLLARSSPPW
jgi:hypothetical protein